MDVSSKSQRQYQSKRLVSGGQWNLSESSHVVRRRCGAQHAFRGRTSNRFGIGVRVDVLVGDLSLSQQLAGGTSFAVTHQPALSFGLGNYSKGVTIKIHWPSGQEQTAKITKLHSHWLVDERFGLLLAE